MGARPGVRQNFRHYAEGWEYPCTSCHRILPAFSFYPRKDKELVRATTRCRECINTQTNARKHRIRADRLPDWKYDYSFARYILGYSVDKAARWICNGYDDITADDLDLSRMPKCWLPDPTP